MDTIIKQITDVFDGDPVSTLVATSIFIVSIWLYKQIKDGENSELKSYKDLIKRSEEACADILRHAELALGKEISDSEFYATVSGYLSTLDQDTSIEFQNSLSKNTRSISEFKLIALNNLNRLKKEHCPSKPTKIGDQFSNFIGDLLIIFKPVWKTAIILYFILFGIVYTTTLTDAAAFFCTISLIMMVVGLVFNFFDKRISFKIFLLCLVILITLFLISFIVHNIIISVILIILIYIIITLIMRKYINN
ncbi:hypothetical protein CHN56_00983 [Bacillus velezensis]|uniref:hypothetical protein n=1 Tax=Bacillus velezensis TaxID=492670 RepID=UPI000B929559|nr:hypothetical protein [Bacillus velezensis]ASS61527.1 hypothetical protein CHN56_00983 [Bacillus velezensis]